MKSNAIIRLNRHPENFGNEADELTADMFESTLPTQHSHSYYEDEALGLYIGVWDTTDMVETAGPYACDEFMVLLEGKASIKNNKTGELETVENGEAFVIPKGYDCQWQQAGYLRKFYVISEHPDETIPDKPSIENIVNFSESETIPTGLTVKVTGDSFKMKTDKKANAGKHLYQNHNGKFFAGIWQSDALETQMQTFPRNEFIYITSGSLVCIDENNQEHKFIQGDAFFVPQGTPCYWRIDKKVSTYYAVLQS